MQKPEARAARTTVGRLASNESSRVKRVTFRNKQEVLSVALVFANDTMLTTVTVRGIDEASPFDSAQYAPAGGEWETFETNRESARLDTE